MIKALLVDDEPIALKNLSLMIAKYQSRISIAGTADSVTNAIEEICKHQPDVVFLDIQLDGNYSFDILSQFPNRKFEVVFVTAYKEHGISAVKEGALDYILKPLDPLEFYNCIHKIENKFITKSVIQHQESISDPARYSQISIPTIDGLLFIKTADIIFCESDGRYTKFYIKEEQGTKKITVSKNIGEYETVLPEDDFIRIHHHYIINLKFITKYIKGSGGIVVMQNGVELPVSKRKKDDFLKKVAVG